jgi:hypothetical protein
MKYAQNIFLIILTFCSVNGKGQASLVINGGIINITNGGKLVIDNPVNTAIIQTGSGYIKSEGASNEIVWSIGSGNGNTYIIPFGNGADYLPVSFQASSGSGATGKFFFSTYATPTWKNSDYLPPGVPNINSNGVDNSANVIDRFWEIKPQGYSANPTLDNLIFTYSDNEYAPPNTISEATLIAQRWNSGSQIWGDYFPASAINTISNTITVSSIPGTQLFDWWTMVSSSSPLPVNVTYFGASVSNKTVITRWQTASEQNSSHFEVWRSRNGILFDSVGRREAVGSSGVVQQYSFIDISPYLHDSYYRLKIVDRDGRYQWSSTARVTIEDATGIYLYPNPAADNITISSNTAFVNSNPKAKLYDAKGQLIEVFQITATQQKYNTSRLAAGNYHILIVSPNQTQTLSFIKK